MASKAEQPQASFGLKVKINTEYRSDCAEMFLLSMCVFRPPRLSEAPVFSMFFVWACEMMLFYCPFLVLDFRYWNFKKPSRGIQVFFFFFCSLKLFIRSSLRLVQLLVDLWNIKLTSYVRLEQSTEMSNKNTLNHQSCKSLCCKCLWHNQFQFMLFIYFAPFTIKLSVGALQQQKPRA